MNDPSAWVEIGRGAAPTACGLGVALLVLRLLRSSRGLLGGLAIATGAGAAAAVLVVLVLDPDPEPGGFLLFLLAAQVYLLALAACLSSWRLPLAELVALLLFVPALPLQLLVHAGVLSTPGGLGLYLLPPASFMVDLPGWAVGTWSRGGWNPFAWQRELSSPGFGTGALVWALHVGLLLGLAGWGRHRRDRPNPDPVLTHSSK